MIKIIAIAIIAVMAFYVLSKRYMERALRKRVRYGIDMVKIATAERLLRDHLPQYDKAKGFKIAAAMTNILFGETASNHDAQAFAVENNLLLESELYKLQNDMELRNAVDQAVRMKVFQDLHDGPQSMEITRFGAAENLKKYGLVIERSLVPSPPDFLRMAEQYYIKNVSK